MIHKYGIIKIIFCFYLQLKKSVGSTVYYSFEIYIRTYGKNKLVKTTLQSYDYDFT